MQGQITFLLFLGFSVSLFGQQTIEVDGIAGKVLEHKKGLLFDIPSFSYAFGINYRKETNGSEAWHRYWNLPEWEGSLQFLNFGNKEVLGTAISITPGLAFKIRQWKSMNLKLHYGTGLAYLNKPYDAISNTRNNAVGSNFNNITKIRLVLSKTLVKKMEINFGLAFNHFSNGLTNSPNSGLNVYGLHLGLQRRYQKVVKTKLENDFRNQEEDLVYHKWSYHVQGGIGITEFPIAGGPEYPVYVYSIGSSYRYSDFQRLHFGLEQEYSVATYEFRKASYYSDEDAARNARKSIFYVGNELMFGSIFFKTQLGFYIPLMSSYKDEDLHVKIQTSYRPKRLKFKRIQPMIGILVKTHYLVAEYINISTGFDF